jgi:hypothetical protein
VFGSIFDQKNEPGLIVFHGSPLGRQTLLSGVSDWALAPASHELAFFNHFKK